MADGGAPPPGGLSRRGFLAAVGGGVALTGAMTAGLAISPIAPLARLAPRLPGTGPQGLPVNTTAAAAGVQQSAASPDWRLRVEGAVATPLVLSLADLRAMPQRTVDLPIACVEGWSSMARWGGVRLKDVVAAAGGGRLGGVRVESVQQGSPYGTSEVDRAHLGDDLTLLALDLEGEPLDLDHGYPLRLIAPARPGAMQTKWLGRVVVL